MKLTLASDLALPLDAVTEKIAFLGRTGTGKTYAAMKLAEEMLAAGAQVLALDAVGKWYGLRVAGAGAGFPIPVFGGLTGDFPLEATGGKLMADVLVDRAISAVLDVSQFTHAEQTRFTLEFATQFYQRKKAAPSAVHLFLEECQEFVPQNPMPGEQAMLSAFERLWKLGRNFGIGGSLISQRPQEINKKALNQTGTLFVFGMTGPQERKAIESWVSAQGIDEDIAAILPTLGQGEPHVWSPTFLKVSRTVRIAEKRTADVSSTPKVGARAKEKPLTPIDAEQLRTAMAATVERAKADDPRELRKKLADSDRRIKELEKATSGFSTSNERAKPEVKIVETPILKDGQLARVEKVVQAAGKSLETLTALLDEIRGAIAKLVHPTPHTHATTDRQGPVRSQGRRAIPAAIASRPAPLVSPSRGVDLKAMHRKMLTALAQHPDGLSKRKILIHTGYASSGPVSSAFADLVREAWVELAGGSLRVTAAGLSALGPYDLLPVGAALREWLLTGPKLSVMEKALLEAVCAAYPGSIRKGEVLACAGYASSGPVSSAFAKLVGLGYVESDGPAVLRAAEELFD